MAWSYENFYNIGCIFGRAISIDHSRFDHTNILVFTDCQFKINAKLALEMNEREYKVFTIEDGPPIMSKTTPPPNKDLTGCMPTHLSPENSISSKQCSRGASPQDNLDTGNFSSPTIRPIINEQRLCFQDCAASPSKNIGKVEPLLNQKICVAPHSPMTSQLSFPKSNSKAQSLTPNHFTQSCQA